MYQWRRKYDIPFYGSNCCRKFILQLRISNRFCSLYHLSQYFNEKSKRPNQTSFINIRFLTKPSQSQMYLKCKHHISWKFDPLAHEYTTSMSSGRKDAM